MTTHRAAMCPRPAMRRARALALAALASAACLGGAAIAGCGGGGGGGAGAGPTLVLLRFEQDALDNVSLNTVLSWTFSEPLDPATVTGASLEIREGPSFGSAVQGTLAVDGATVTFTPRLAGLCDGSDGSFKSDRQYRVRLSGSPEAFSIRSLEGLALGQTLTAEFHTRSDADPDLYADQLPGTAPTVLGASPADGAEAVKVEDGNRVVLLLSENLSPCSVNRTTVRFHVYQFGDPGTAVAADDGSGNASGFATDATSATSDQTPQDPFTWTTTGVQALVRTLPAPQEIPGRVHLEQSFEGTRILITPTFGYSATPGLNRSRFPEDALVVVEVTPGIEDLGGLPLAPFVLAFTTENLPPQAGVYEVDTKGETPWDETASTARIIESGTGQVQGFLLFAGDGDNGANLLSPALPQSDADTCASDYQANDGALDDFDPSADVLLDTGSTPNPCANSTDGSQAVVWEFRSFRIRSGVTVRVIGANPAIILTQGDVTIDAGGRLLLRGDGQGGAPAGQGEGNKSATTSAGTVGGIGVAGGGGGGSSKSGSGTRTPARYGGHGLQGYYHANATGLPATDIGDAGGTGGGHGNTSCLWTEQVNPNNRNTPSGGGGGHAVAGAPGSAAGTGNAPTLLDNTPDGAAGAAYGQTSGKMYTPEAGSGGGAGGELRPFSSNVGRGPGGAGGAGGGFIDLTSTGDIHIFGTIDAAGAAGGSNPGANFTPNYSWNPGTGGGGGGSGGGIRLLTPGDIVFSSTTLVTAAGGAGGAGGASQGVSPPLTHGGAGGAGRIVLEDSNSVITGLSSADVTPSEGSSGFYRGVFDGARFRDGETRSVALSAPFVVGPFDPQFQVPAAADFDALAPASAVAASGATVMLLEARGFQMLPGGSPDLSGIVAAPTPWHTVGHFADSGVELAPTWIVGQPPLAEIGGSLPAGNSGILGLQHLDGCEFIQLRVSFFLRDGVSAADPGPALDLWRIRFISDQ